MVMGNDGMTEASGERRVALAAAPWPHAATAHGFGAHPARLRSGGAALPGSGRWVPSPAARRAAGRSMAAAGDVSTGCSIRARARLALLVLLAILASSGTVSAAEPADAAAGLGGDGTVRVRELGVGGARVLELHQAGRWVERWRTPEPDEDGDRGTTLRWVRLPALATAAAVRFRWESSAWLCGQGPLWLEPEVYQPRSDRFVPLPGWLHRPDAALGVSPWAPVAPSPLAPAVHFVTGSPVSPTVRPELLADGLPGSGWGRTVAASGPDLVATGVVDAETPWWALVLEPLTGRPLPEEAWLLLEGSAHRLPLGEVAVDQGAGLAVALPAEVCSTCISLVIPHGQRGALGEVRVLTRADAQGEGALGIAAATLAVPGPAARAAARRFAGTGTAGLRALAQAFPTVEPAVRLWGEAVVRTGATGAAALIFDRLQAAPPHLQRALEQALPLLGAQVWTELGRRLSESEPGSLGPLLAWLGPWGARHDACRRLPLDALARLLRPEAGLDLLLQAVRSAGALGCAKLQTPLLELARHEDEQTRRAALAALPGSSDGAPLSPALAALEGALADPSPDVRQQALLGLARLSSRRGGAALAEPGRVRVAALLARDPWPDVRAAALLAAAAWFEPASLLGPLRAALADNEPQVRAQALRTALDAGLAAEVVDVARQQVQDPGELLDNRLQAVHVLHGAGEAGLAALRQLAQQLAPDVEDPAQRQLARAVRWALGEEPAAAPPGQPMRQRQVPDVPELPDDGAR